MPENEITCIFFEIDKGMSTSNQFRGEIERPFTNLNDISTKLAGKTYTRQALDLHIDPTNTKLAKNTIKTQGPMIWNLINKTIKNCRSLVSFKNSLKKYILAQYESNVTTNKYAKFVHE